MNRIYVLVLFLFVIGSAVGCGDGGNKEATQDEMKAHVEQHGDTMLVPTTTSDPLPK